MEKEECFYTAVGMQTSTTTTENTMQIPQRTRDRTVIQCCDTALGHITKKKHKTGYSKNTCTLMFIAALLWKQT
jgi:hypothetical protein